MDEIWGQVKYGLTSTQFNEIKAQWKFRLNALDLEIGRRYWLSHCFTFRPSLGIKAGWTKTNFDLKATLKELSNGGVNQINIANENDFQNTYWGFGLAAGVEPRFYFTRCLSLYGGLNFALLWGRFQTKLDCDQNQFTNLANFTSILYEYDYSYTTKADFYGMQSIFDLEIGLRFETKFCCDRFLVAGEIGWEHQTWFELNPRYYRNNQGNLATQQSDLVSGEEVDNSVDFGGLVVKLGFDF